MRLHLFINKYVLHLMFSINTQEAVVVMLAGRHGTMWVMLSHMTCYLGIVVISGELPGCDHYTSSTWPHFSESITELGIMGSHLFSMYV